MTCICATLQKKGGGQGAFRRDVSHARQEEAHSPLPFPGKAYLFFCIIDNICTAETYNL